MGIPVTATWNITATPYPNPLSYQQTTIASGPSYATTATSFNSASNVWLFTIWYFANNASRVNKFYAKPYKLSLRGLSSY